MLVVVAVTLSGCVIYLDNPPRREILGRITQADSGQPMAGAYVWFRSGRKPFSLLPFDTFGIDASARTDADGRFSVAAKLKDMVESLVQDDTYFQTFKLPPFPPSNRIDGIEWAVSQRKANGVRPASLGP